MEQLIANDGSSNNAINDNTPPTNFVSERLSSSSVDTQNEQKIKTINLQKIFFMLVKIKQKKLI